MAMKACKECGAEISESAKSCPKCGKTLDNVALRVVSGIIMMLLGLFLLFGFSCNIQTTIPTGTSTSKKQGEMTLEKFEQIKVGMTYEEVVDIVGEEGTLSTESAYETQSMKIYYWYASDGISNATISFINNEVTAKNQLGL